jgi:hypothetical protein
MSGSACSVMNRNQKFADDLDISHVTFHVTLINR